MFTSDAFTVRRDLTLVTVDGIPFSGFGFVGLRETDVRLPLSYN